MTTLHYAEAGERPFTNQRKRKEKKKQDICIRMSLLISTLLGKKKKKSVDLR